MKKLLIAVFVLVAVSGWCAGTTKIDEGLTTRTPRHTFIYTTLTGSPQAPAAGTRYALPWAAPAYDVLGEMAGATFTPKLTGRYSVIVCTAPNSASTGQFYQHQISVDGVADARSVDGRSSIAVYGYVMTSKFEIMVVAGAKVEVLFVNSEAAPLGLVAASSKLIIEYIGPLP